MLPCQVKREWEIGRCIHNIYEPARALPGYMGTGEGVVTENGNFVGASVNYWKCMSHMQSNVIWLCYANGWSALQHMLVRLGPRYRIMRSLSSPCIHLCQTMHQQIFLHHKASCHLLQA